MPSTQLFINMPTLQTKTKATRAKTLRALKRASMELSLKAIYYLILGICKTLARNLMYPRTRWLRSQNLKLWLRLKPLRIPWEVLLSSRTARPLEIKTLNKRVWTCLSSSQTSPSIQILIQRQLFKVQVHNINVKEQGLLL